ALLDARRPFIARLRNPMIWGTVVVVALLGLLAPYLPSAFQRALTWIPFAHVSDITSADAEGTSLWRFELWRMLLREAPQYLWVGKGYVFSFSEYASIFSTSTANQYESFIITHNYHNGLLSLLIDLGLPGLVIGLGYIAAVAVRETRRLYYVWPNTVLHNYHRIVLAAFLAQAIVFVGFAGGVQSFMSLFVLALIADGLFHSAQKTPPTKH
ncbi:MAG: O-antigen ligase family protein, partial [bacterium]